jgi:hypothetical protein
MGDIYLDITVMNDADLEKQKEVQFLAGTGATRAWIPKTLARELNIKEVGKVPLELANGKFKNIPTAFANLNMKVSWSMARLSSAPRILSRSLARMFCRISA